jgi:hypothetical protein
MGTRVPQCRPVARRSGGNVRRRLVAGARLPQPTVGQAAVRSHPPVARAGGRWWAGYREAGRRSVLRRLAGAQNFTDGHPPVVHDMITVCTLASVGAPMRHQSAPDAPALRGG